MNIILNKDIILNNFTYIKDINKIKKCTNLIYVICNSEHFKQIKKIKKIEYSKIFIIIDIENITNNEQVEYENIIKNKFDNINNTNLFTRNKIYDWNLILDIIHKNLEKNTLKINYYKCFIYISIIIILSVPTYIYITKNTQLEQMQNFIDDYKISTNKIINELNNENEILKNKLEKYENNNKYLKNELDDFIDELKKCNNESDNFNNKLQICNNKLQICNNELQKNINKIKNFKKYIELKERINMMQYMNANIKNETLIKNIN